MGSHYLSLLKEKMSEDSFAKLMKLENTKVNDFLGTFAKHCNPKSIYICDDSKEDEAYIKAKALEIG